MARLPSERYLVQQIGTDVVLFEDGTECEIVRFSPSDQSAVARAQKVISLSLELGDEDKSFAHFWCGYFYAADSPAEVRIDRVVKLVSAFTPGLNDESELLEKIMRELTAGSLGLEA
jgi:hypothetical protein